MALDLLDATTPFDTVDLAEREDAALARAAARARMVAGEDDDLAAFLDRY